MQKQRARPPIGLSKGIVDGAQAEMPAISYEADPAVQAVRNAETTEAAWEILSQETLPNGIGVTVFIPVVAESAKAVLAGLESAGLVFSWDGERWRANPRDLVAQHADVLLANKAGIEAALFDRFNRTASPLIDSVIRRFTDPPTDRMQAWLHKVTEAEMSYDLERIKRLCGVTE